MPTGPKGQKRPADVIGNAVRVMRIATGEEAEDVQNNGKDAVASRAHSRLRNARGRATGDAIQVLEGVSGLQS
tara:strand:- start:207 stop:425 length:219 start_codon:yes stop_codon:yes gene_type:complete